VIDKTGINVELHNLLCSLQVQLKALTDFHRAIEMVTLLSTTVSGTNSQMPLLKQKTNSTISVGRKLLNDVRAASRSTTSPLSVLDARLQKLVIHTVMNACALECATGKVWLQTVYSET
jgi:hypothetical protein